LAAHLGPADTTQILGQWQRLRALRSENIHVEQHQNETSSIVAPVRQHGTVVAVLGAFLPTYRFVAAHRQAVLDAMSRTASRVEAHPSISGTTLRRGNSRA